MATPIDERRHVDERTLARFTESLVEAGVHGLFPGSSIGEFPSLTREQNRTVVRTVAGAADDETLVLAGCCDTSVDGVVDLIDAADAAGADGAVVVSPYYLDTTQAGLRRFFERVADRSTLPLLLYNIPGLTGNEITVETVAALADHDRIVGLKDTSGDLTYHHDAVANTPEEFAVLQGATELAAASLDLGADGIISGPANVFPGAMRRLYEAHRARDYETVASLMREVVTPMVSATADVPTAAALKHLISLHGRDVGGPLPPLPDLTAAERETLESCYRVVVDRVEERRVEQ
jgi:4-hydroxy-tetrahydrodipicolinate synthase